MRKNIAAVIAAFLEGSPAVGDSRRTCWTDGEILYSYAMPIAWRKHPKYGCLAVVAYECAPTATTRGHVRAAESEVPGALRVWTSPKLDKLLRPWSQPDGFALAPAPSPAERRQRAAVVILESAAPKVPKLPRVSAAGSW